MPVLLAERAMQQLFSRLRYPTSGNRENAPTATLLHRTPGHRMLDPRIMRAGFIAAKQLLALSAGVALHDASERPWTFRAEEHRPCWPTAIDAFRASLWPLQLAPGRTFEILPGNFRQGFAERAQTPLAHDAFGMTNSAVGFIHPAILNPPAQLNPCAQIVPTICVSDTFATSGTTQNQQLTRRQCGAEERPPLPAPLELILSPFYCVA